MRISIVSGLCVQHDAISNAVLHQRQILHEAGHEVKVFTQYTDVLGETDVFVIADPWALAGHPFYAESDLVVFHFGIRYELFNALVLEHPRAVRAVHFHNVTPPELLSGTARWAASEGLDQIAVADRADVIWSVSPHNTEVLLSETEVDVARVRAMPLCVPMLDRSGMSRARSGPVRILSVGRFVEAKGLHTLIEAFSQVPGDVRGDARLVLVGGLSHSDPGYLECLHDLVGRAGVRGQVVFNHDVAEDDLRDLYLDADVYVSASRHEGFCVPVIEALSAGCEVVVSDAGALPDTLAGFGTVVPVDDVGELATALAREIDRARRAASPESIAARRRYVHQFDRQASRRRLLFEVQRAVNSGKVRTMTPEDLDPQRYAGRQGKLLARLGCPRCHQALLAKEAIQGGGALADAELHCPVHGRVGVVDSFHPAFLERDLEQHEAGRDGFITEFLDLGTEVVAQGEWRPVQEGMLSEGFDGDSLTFECSEGGFEIVFRGHDWSGMAEVEVEGGPSWSLDLYRAPFEDVVLRSGRLGPGNHRINILPTGERAAESHAAQVIVRECRRFVAPELVRTPSLAALNRGNPYPPRFLELVEQQAPDAMILDCGGGDRRFGDDRVYNLEYLDFELPDLFADGLCLPFLDDTWDLIMSQAVLEHVPDPQVAVDELVRALKPGGLVYIEAAFMQPLHAVPSHYMNITPFGIEYLCRDLEILDSGVFGGLSETLTWIGDIVGAEEKLGAERFAELLHSLRDLDAKLSLEELRQTASAVFLLGRKRTSGG